MRRFIVLTLMLLLGPASSAQGHLAREHMPTFCSTPTIQTARNGAWAEPTTWRELRPPRAGDCVLVSHDLTYGVASDEALGAIRIAPRGTLRFDRSVSTRLTVGTLQVFGALEVGTPAAPIDEGVTAEIVIAAVPIDTSVDPAQTATGLLAVEASRITMHGRVVSTPFARLAAEPAAGDAVLHLDAAVDWRPGDEVIVPDTRQLRRADRGIPESARAESGLAAGGQVLGSRHEYVRIVAMRDTAATLAAPLAWTHPGARSPDGVLERLPMVANLTRNVVVRSADPAGLRGHGFFMERATVDLRYTLWQDLGRTTVDPLDSTQFDKAGHVTRIGTNQLGRYAVHFHRLRGPARAKADYQYTFVGNVVAGCLRWCVAIHDSHYGLLKWNVIVGRGHGKTGAGLVWEQGNEYRNTVEDTFVADFYGIARNPEQHRGRFVTDFGREGHGLWSNSHFSEFKNVHVFGVGSVGFFWNRVGVVHIPAYPGSDMMAKGTTVKVTPSTVVRTEGLEVAGAVIGFEPWQWFSGALENVVARYAIWHSALWAVKPAYVSAGGGLTFEDLWIRGDVTALQDPLEWPVAIKGNINYFSRAALKRADIQGMRVGIRPATYYFTAEDVTLRNYVNVEVIFNRIAAGTRIQSIPRVYEYREFRRVHFHALDAGLPAAASGSAHIIGASRSDSWTLEPHFNVFRDSCFDGTCYPSLKGYFDNQDAAAIWPLTGLTNQESFVRYGVSAFLEIAPCAASVAPAVVGLRLCEGIAPVSGLGFKLSQNSVEGGNKASQRPPADGLYTLVYDVCLETFEGECAGSGGPAASRQWRVEEREPVQLVKGRNWLTRTVCLDPECPPGSRTVVHSFVVDWTP